MDEELRKQALREELKRRNRGRQMVTAKYTPKYPEGAEREYLRLVSKYMTEERDVITAHIPELKRIISYGTELNTDSKESGSDKNKKKRRAKRLASMGMAAGEIDRLFESIERQLESAFGLYKLREGLEKIAGLNHRLTTEEWRKTVNRTLGIDIFGDYYSGGRYREMLDVWISDNVDLISTMPKESLARMKELVYDNYMAGETATDIVKAMQDEFGMSKSHARMVARDQNAKLNARITREQHREAGIESYVWRTCHDERVRDCHNSFDGQTFRYDDPPEIWYSTKNGIVYTGRHCNPGEDYQCRCVASPVINLDKVDLPT
jgi:SPP1 gp7 family putative phage head morphogenesis protein